MGKAPAFQFYIRDWLSDPQLRATSTSTKGIWIDLLCFMWEAPDRGRLVDVTVEQVAKMTGATVGEVNIFLSEANTLKFATVTERDKKVTVENRRMVREERERRANAERQSRFRAKKQTPNNGQSNEKVTSLSSSSSSTSSSTSTSSQKNRGSKDPLGQTTPTPSNGKLSAEQQARFDRFWAVYPKKRAKGQALNAWKKIRPDETLAGQIVNAVEQWTHAHDWIKEGGKYIPHPATWLNAMGWEDEPTSVAVMPYSETTAQNIQSIQEWMNEDEKNPE